MPRALQPAPAAEITDGFSDPIVRQSVRELVADKLSAMIDCGVLRSGDDLPGERDLAATLGVSRDSVRGGIQLLVGRGVLAVLQGTRTRVLRKEADKPLSSFAEVRSPSRYRLEQIHQARMLVEAQVLELAAQAIEPKTLEFLSHSLQVQRTAVDDPLRFLMIDREFHLALYQSSGNPVLADYVGELHACMLDVRRIAVSQPGAIARSIREHEAIVEALRAGSATAARRCMRAHIEQIYRSTRKLVGSASPHAKA